MNWSAKIYMEAVRVLMITRNYRSRAISKVHVISQSKRDSFDIAQANCGSSCRMFADNPAIICTEHIMCILMLSRESDSPREGEWRRTILVYAMNPRIDCFLLSRACPFDSTTIVIKSYEFKIKETNYQQFSHYKQIQHINLQCESFKIERYKYSSFTYARLFLS